MSSLDQPPRTPAPDSTVRRWRDRALLGSLLGLVVFGLVGLAAATGWEETLAQLAKLSLSQFAILLGLSLINYVLRGLRWHLFTRRLALGTGLAQDLRHFLGGFAMSVTPGRVGELVRMRWIRRETGRSFDRTAPLALVDRAADLAAMAVLLAVALMTTATHITGALPMTAAAMLLAWTATRPTLLAAFATLSYRALGQLPRLFARIRRASRTLEVFTHGGTLALSTALGFVGWLAEALAFYLLLTWMGTDIGIGIAIAIFLFATLAGGLTGAPGGIGGAEAAMVGLLTLEGVGLNVALPATAIIRVTTLWFAIAIGLIVFPIAERYSMKGKYALEKN